MIARFARWITHHTKAVLVIAVLLLIPSVIGAVCTYVNYDILSYLPEDLDSTKGQEILDETFHNAASSMLIIENLPAKDIVPLQENIRRVEGVNDAIWISDITDISVPADILPDEIRNIFYSTDRQSTMILIKYDHPGSSKETMAAIDDIRGLMSKQSFLSGLSVIVKDTKDLADRELPIYVGLAVLLSLVAMSLSMESWLLPFLFLLDIFFAVVYNFGSNIFLGQISYITKCIAAVLQLGVTMDYSIFLIDRYEEEKRRFADSRDAMAHAIERTFVSLSGSSLTTIFGFVALCFMRLTLGRDIGIVMVKGVVLGVLTVVIILPALILACDKPIHRWRHRSLIPHFDRLNRSVTKHRAIYVCLFLVLLVPAYIAQANTAKYYNLDRSLPQDLPSIVATNKLKDEFNMASTHFIVVDDSLPANDLTEMTQQIEKVAGIESVISYNKFVGPTIPDSFVPQAIKDLCKKDGYQLLMVNSRYKAAMDDENAQIDALNAIVKAYDPAAMITGEGALTKDLIDIANTDFMVTNAISIIAIFLIIAICFKSISVPLIVVSVIELAIFINLGIPYLTGTVIPFISPTVIGCVQLGATVDYAILLTTRFREELRAGHDRLTAIQIAANASDRSIVSSALVFFCATFGVYMISKIEIIKSICAMLARGAIISAVVILLILTPLLLVTERFLAKTSLSWYKGKPEKPETPEPPQGI